MASILRLLLLNYQKDKQIGRANRLQSFPEETQSSVAALLPRWRNSITQGESDLGAKRRQYLLSGREVKTLGKLQRPAEGKGALPWGHNRMRWTLLS